MNCTCGNFVSRITSNGAYIAMNEAGCLYTDYHPHIEVCANCGRHAPDEEKQTMTKSKITLQPGDYVNIEGIDKESYIKLHNAFVEAGFRAWESEDTDFSLWKFLGVDQQHDIILYDFQDCYGLTPRLLTIEQVLVTQNNQEDNTVKIDEKNSNEEIDCSRPEDYLVCGRTVVHLWQNINEITEYLYVDEDGVSDWAHFRNIEKKPQFKPEVGKWYYHPSCGTVLEYTGSEYPERYTPIPQHIKELMAFEDE